MFDDVEKFISKLQKSAEATRVLEHRERSRRTRHREAGGEGRHPAAVLNSPSLALRGHSQISSLSPGLPLHPLPV